MNNIKGAEIFKALSDENRLLILEILKDGEMCADELFKKLSISQPTLSHHMKILCREGIVTFRKSGRRVYYMISKDGIEDLVGYLLGLSANGKKSSDNKRTTEEKQTSKKEKTVKVKIEEEKTEIKKDDRTKKNDIWLF